MSPVLLPTTDELALPQPLFSRCRLYRCSSVPPWPPPLLSSTRCTKVDRSPHCVISVVRVLAGMAGAEEEEEKMREEGTSPGPLASLLSTPTFA